MMATRIEACTFGTLENQPWAGELQRGEGSCVRSLGDLKRILETMHLGRRDAGDGASHSDEEEAVGREGHTTSAAEIGCATFVGVFYPNVRDPSADRRPVAAKGSTAGWGCYTGQCNRPEYALIT